MELEYNYLLECDVTLLEAEAEKVGRQQKTAVVVIGKFSPPQVGHYKLITAAAKYQKVKKLDSIFVCIAYRGKPKADDIVSAIPPEDRIDILQQSGKANIVPRDHFIPANGAFAAFVNVRKAGYEPIAICTADAASEKSYLELLDKYFKNDDDTPIQHFAVPGITRDEESQGANETSKKSNALAILQRMVKSGELSDEDSSASLARAAAEHGYGPEFVKITGLEKNLPLANKVFNQLRRAMGLENMDIKITGDK